MTASRKEDFKRNNACSLYDLNGHALAQEPLPRGHEINNSCRPFLGHYYCILRLPDPSPEVEKKIFTEIHRFYTLKPKIITAWGGIMKLKFFLSPHPT